MERPALPLEPSPTDLACLRPARLQDLPDLLHLEEKSFTSDRLDERKFRYFLTKSPALFLVAVAEEEELLGYILLLYNRYTRAARVYSLAVAGQSRGKGLASQMLAQALDFAKKRGAKRIFLEVRCGNKAAQALYERFSFQPLRTLPGYYQDGEAALKMVRTL